MLSCALYTHNSCAIVFYNTITRSLTFTNKQDSLQFHTPMYPTGLSSYIHTRWITCTHACMHHCIALQSLTFLWFREWTTTGQCSWWDSCRWSSSFGSGSCPIGLCYCVVCYNASYQEENVCSYNYNYNASTYSVKYKFTGLDVLEHKDGHLEIINPIQQGHIALEFMCFGTLATPTINPICW